MKIVIAGGDRRMKLAAEKFREAGYDCGTVFLGEPEKSVPKDASVVILPTPFEKNGFFNAPITESKIPIDRFFSSIPKSSLVIGGGVPENGGNEVDISKREDFQRKNAVPTAEAAILIALERSDKTLRDSNIAVIGYGRIGCYLSNLLLGFGANVRVVARREEARISAESSGANAFSFENIKDAIESADIIFNTVPSPIIRENDIPFFKSDSLFIDLASLPGGVTEEVETALGERFERALALPGKHFPETAKSSKRSTVYESVSRRRSST
jgi:dipicolinate synthase subunit A